MSVINRKIKEAESVIQTRFKYIDNVEEIAHMVGCNYNTLRTYFVRINGKSLVEYINEIRCLYAKNILVNSNCKLFKIAHDVGFKNDKYFITVFKKLHGITPSEYRKNSKNEIS